MPPTRDDLIQPPASNAPRDRSVTDYDALADLFLGDAPPAPASAPSVSAPIVEPGSAERGPRATASASAPEPPELLVAGHLPVLSGAWVVQYASRLARQTGRPVALAQLGAERTTVQILWSRTPEARPDQTHDLRLAVRAANKARARWLIATDDISVIDLLAEPRLTGACLLTAPNEAATVAAYQTLKSIAAELARCEREHDFALRLALAGAGEDDARRVRDRIGRASSVFMGRRIELAASIERIGPTIATPLFDSARTVEPAHLLDLIDEPIAPVSEPPRVAPARPAPRRAPAFTDDTLGPIPMDPARRPDERPTPPASRDTLCSCIEDEVLRPTALRCPDAASVEIAMDETGALHALAHAAGPSPEGAVRDLCIARAWLERQALLVNLALHRSPETRIETHGHIFVPRAAPARALLDAPIRVHLLRTQTAGDRMVTICEPLN